MKDLEYIEFQREYEEWMKFLKEYVCHELNKKGTVLLGKVKITLKPEEINIIDPRNSFDKLSYSFEYRGEIYEVFIEQIPMKNWRQFRRDWKLNLLGF